MAQFASLDFRTFVLSLAMNFGGVVMCEMSTEGDDTAHRAVSLRIADRIEQRRQVFLIEAVVRGLIRNPNRPTFAT